MCGGAVCADTAAAESLISDSVVAHEPAHPEASKRKGRRMEVEDVAGRDLRKQKFAGGRRPRCSRPAAASVAPQGSRPLPQDEHVASNGTAHVMR
jgi:hypothetical protein